jgi:hypothetical protein
MRFDRNIYFPQVKFPDGEWRTILARFHAGAGTSAEAREWFVVTGESAVWITLEPAPARPGSCIPKGTRWIVVLDTAAGREPAAVWAQFAIPYHTLAGIPGVSVHDCQHCEAGLFTAADAFRRFAGQVMPQFHDEGVRAFVDQGLMTAEGMPVF